MKSLLKAIDTIDAVAEAGNVGIRELSAITGFPPSTIHRIVTTLVERDRIINDLQKIRSRGYSVDNQEMEEGVRCVAALIFGHQGKPAASVSITGAAMRVTPDRIEQFGTLVKACAAAISSQLGFNPANAT